MRTQTTTYQKNLYTASGNAMATYKSVGGASVKIKEHNIFGSSRLGIALSDIVMTDIPASTTELSRVVGEKYYELSNHLGNVLSTISDKPLGVDGGNGKADYYLADIVSANDYYPGVYAERSRSRMMMPGRKFSSEAYRYGFNGMEKDDELKGSGNSYDFGARLLDVRLGRWLAMDPMTSVEPGWTPYRAFYNSPISYNDPTGMLESTDVTKNEDGTYTVVGGDLTDGDKGIYVVTKNKDGNYERTGEKIGESLTLYSFYNEDKDDKESERGWKGTIDPNSTKGKDFFEKNIKKDNTPGLLSYMWNATKGKKYDFKRLDENGKPLDEKDSRYNNRNYHHRGSKWETKKNIDGTTTIIYATARDVGNYSAGYVAGYHGFSWTWAEKAFNGLELFESNYDEGRQSKAAQKLGHSSIYDCGGNLDIFDQDGGP